jgi:hypothetical protein
VAPGTGEVLAEHPLCAAGESSIIDEHYGRACPTTPGRKLRPRSQAETAFSRAGTCTTQGQRRLGIVPFRLTSTGHLGLL